MTPYICRRPIGAAEILAISEPQRSFSRTWRDVTVKTSEISSDVIRIPEAAFAKRVPLPGDWLIERDGGNAFVNRADFERDYVRVPA